MTQHYSAPNLLPVEDEDLVPCKGGCCSPLEGFHPRELDARGLCEDCRPVVLACPYCEAGLLHYNGAQEIGDGEFARLFTCLNPRCMPHTFAA